MPFMTDQVKIVLGASATKNWVEIDAIKLTGSNRPKGNLQVVLWTNDNLLFWIVDKWDQALHLPEVMSALDINIAFYKMTELKLTHYSFNKSVCGSPYSMTMLGHRWHRVVRLAYGWGWEYNVGPTLPLR